MDLGIMFVAYLMLPLSTFLNIILLFPLPQFLKRRMRTLFSGFLLKVLILSILLFALTLYTYSITSFEVGEHDPVEYRLEAKAKQWKLERNYHITFFNLVNWMVCAGAERLLTRLDAKNAKKQ